MSEQPIEEQARKAAKTAPPAPPAPPPGTALALPDRAEIDKLLGAHVIPVREWVAALVEQEAFEETDAEDAALSIVRAILTADSPEAVFGAMQCISVKDLLGDDPGARSSVYQINGARPLASTFEEGPSCFCVIDAINLAEREHVTLSCGARAVQAAILAHMIHGWLPMRAVFTRRRKPTRRGFYPVNLESGV